MHNEEIIKHAARAGQIMLEAGGETYRVEDTINRILTSYGIGNAQSFVTPTGIIISGEGAYCFNTSSGLIRLNVVFP